MKIIYAGTPEFAVPALRALIAVDGHEVIAVYTQPDRPAGRGRKLRASPVKKVALEAGISVYQPVSLRDPDVQHELAALQPDLMLVAAYGLMLPQVVLDTPRYGCLNIHASLLPRWRGAAPIHRAILAGDQETGVTIMQMAAGLDTGDMLVKKTVPIMNSTTTAELHDELAQLGAEALLETLSLMEGDQLSSEAQDDALANYAHKLEKAESEIDWSLSVAEIDRKIRAFNPWPVAQTYCSAGVLRIYEAQPEPRPSPSAACGEVLEEDRRKGIAVQAGDGLIWIKKLQMPGGKRLEATQFLNGKSLQGERLTGTRA